MRLLGVVLIMLGVAIGFALGIEGKNPQDVYSEIKAIPVSSGSGPTATQTMG